ncbi:MAG: leucine-rich repeat domain-containing protein [Candidatus Poribacteria bacterium]|nr:leucine-rich repeat domain-containing protein [Candidatus Poribacteria bacterium]
MKRFSTFFVICLTLNCWFSVANAQTVRMPDANLAAVVRDALGLAPNAPITRQAMQGLTSLDAQSYKIREITGRDGEIKDLTGLEHATQLTQLWLTNNQISDIRLLAGLTQLRDLGIANNQISDITLLARLTQLESLEIAHNPINNLRPLAELTQLRYLSISVRRISDIQLHVDLTQLESLEIYGGDWESSTPISDLYLLGNLTQLTSLSVHYAQVSDLSFLRALTQLEGLNLGSNQISDLKPLAGLTQLRWLFLWDNQISDLKPLAGLTQLTDLGLSNNQIRDVSPLAGLTNLNSLYLGDNPIQDTSPLANLPNLHYVDIPIPPQISISNEIPDELPEVGKTLRYRVQIRNAQNLTGFKLIYETPHKLTAVKFVAGFDGVEHNPRTNPRSGTLTASRLETGQDIRNVAIFTLNATAAGKGDLRVLGQLTTTQRQFNVDIRYPITIYPSDETQPADNAGVIPIPDANLAKAVRKALELGNNARITNQQMLKLSVLEAKNSKIKNLTGLEHAKNLIELRLDRNQIRNLNPLSGLTRLKRLTLDENQISNVRPLTKLTQLDWLNIGGSPIKNTGVRLLAELKHLRGLSLYRCQIGNITPLAKLTKLESLWLDYNQIRDVSPLAGLTNLRTLYLRENQIRDVSPLGKLTELTELRLADNPIEDVGPLATLKKLEDVDIEIPPAAPTLVMSVPEKTDLHPNYPNPFNPETWIPYQLAEPSRVSISIYAADGKLVRTLDLGHQALGHYDSRSRAAYWDGRNALGEPVASGVYFYTLTAGKFTATRKMLITK